MAAPHVAGAAALLQQRHPDVDGRADQVGARRRPATRCTRRAAERGRRRRARAAASSTSPRADNPLLFAVADRPLVRRSSRAARPRTQHGRAHRRRRRRRRRGRAVEPSQQPGGATPSPSRRPVDRARARSTRHRDRRHARRRRRHRLRRPHARHRRRAAIPFWFHVDAPAARAREPRDAARRARHLQRQHARRPVARLAYRYPDDPGRRRRPDVPAAARSRSSAFALDEPVANFGVVVTRAAGVQRRAAPRRRRRREPPRRLHRRCRSTSTRTGELRRRRARSPARSCPRRAPTTSSSTRRPAPSAGPFTFRFWVNDTTPPRSALLTDAAARHAPARGRPTPAPASIRASLVVEGRRQACAASRTRTASLTIRERHGRGRHTRRVHAPPTTRRRRTWRTSAPILPNTRTFCDERRRPLARLAPVSSSIVGRFARSRSTLAAKSSASVRLDDAERRLPLRAVAAPPRLGADARVQACTEPRPLRTDHDGDGQCEQGDVQPAHGSDLTRGAKPIGPLGRYDPA